MSIISKYQVIAVRVAIGPTLLTGLVNVILHAILQCACSFPCLHAFVPFHVLQGFHEQALRALAEVADQLDPLAVAAKVEPEKLGHNVRKIFVLCVQIGLVGSTRGECCIHGGCNVPVC